MIPAPVIIAGDALRQILALDQFHHEGLRAARSFEAVDRRDVRMIERRQRLRLALEAGEPLGILRERIRQDLERDLPAKAGVGGAIDRAHTALANRRGDFVDAEARASREGQGAA
jgi:hypothetical protein